MNDCVIRPAISADAAGCAAVLREWIDETEWFRSAHPASADEPFLAALIARQAVTVVDAGSQVVGFMVLDEAYLHSLYLRWAYRGRGLGHQLLERARSRSPGGLGLWTFQANHGARRFYEREGFVAMEMTDGEGNEEKLPDIRYHWQGRAE